MSNVPKGASSSPYGSNSYAELAKIALNALERMHPNASNINKDNCSVSVEVKPEVEDESVNIKPAIKKDRFKVTDVKVDETEKDLRYSKSAFDKEFKSEIIKILVENNLNIIEVSDSKINFEHNGNRFSILPQ